MTSLRHFTMNDLLCFNNVNLDVLTETYHLSFYMSYMIHWPESFVVAVFDNRTIGGTTNTSTTSSSSTSHSHEHVNFHPNTGISPSSSTPTTPHSSSSILMGYVLGKAEGDGPLWHGHVSAVTVAQSHRRIQMAKYLMQHFERQSEDKHNYFVDLFVRTSNALAIQMYHNLGYQIYRRVIGYYQNSLNTNTGSGSSSRSSNTTNTPTAATPEDAYDMRKSLSRDPNQLSMIPLPHPIYPEDLEW